MEEKKLNSKIFDLILGRVLKRAWLDFDNHIKESIKNLASPNKTKLSKKQMPDLKKLFEEESKNIIRKLRELEGLTQEKLARLADVANNTIIKIEAGKNQNPTLETLKRVA
jgi:DNA-binding XRE family transcriptional regulator